MSSIKDCDLLDTKPRQLLEMFLREYQKVHEIDEEKARRYIKEAISYYGHQTSRGPYHDQWEQRWYDSLETFPYNSRPAYELYADDYYFCDLWSCWHIYSRKYLRAIRHPTSLDKTSSIYDRLGTIKSVVDLGCGLGLTSAALTQVFPDASIYGTNLEGTKQYEFCEYISKGFANFNMFSSIEDIAILREWSPDESFVFASEYFEHIYDATDHLEDILSSLNPRFLYVANAFNTIAMGHFTTYYLTVNPDKSPGVPYCDQKNIGKIFSRILREYGYAKLKTNLWNNRPNLWERR